jgi:hypothetical protein
MLTAAVPMMVAYAPASVSSSCDDMLDQLNDISFLGDVEHKERCTRLRHSLTHLNRGQGLGFRVMGTVIDTRYLAKIVGVIIGGGSTMYSFAALGRGRALDPLGEGTCGVEVVAACCDCNCSGSM